nr:olfactory receptor 87 [Microplitis mediator]
MSTIAINNITDLTVAGEIGGFIIGLIMCLLKFLKFTTSYDEIMNHVDVVFNPINILQQSSDQGIVMCIKNCAFREEAQVTLFFLPSSFLPLLMLFFGHKQKVGLPIKTQYPINTAMSPNRELAVFFQSYLVAYCITILLASDMLVIGLIRWSTMQFAALSSNYQNCNSKLVKRATLVSPKETFDILNKCDAMKITDEDMEIHTFLLFEENEIEKNIDDSFSLRFITCIKNHQRLMKVIHDLNATFSMFLLLQFATSLTVICLNGFQMILNLDDVKNFMQFAIFIAAMLEELFIYCWYGNEFTWMANSLSYNQWLSGWEYVNDKNNNSDHNTNNNCDNNKLSNLITISMIQTMRPLEFKAVGIFILSMPTFLSVVKSSYSALALLITIMDKT